MTAEDTSYQGIVVIEYDSFGKGSKKLWNQFLKNVKDHKDCAIVICQYTVEGDPILQYVSNVNGKFYYVEDSTRDAYGSENTYSILMTTTRFINRMAITQQF